TIAKTANTTNAVLILIFLTDYVDKPCHWLAAILGVDDIIIGANGSILSIYLSIPRSGVVNELLHELSVPVEDLHHATGIAFEVFNHPSVVNSIAIRTEDVWNDRRLQQFHKYIVGSLTTLVGSYSKCVREVCWR